MLKIGVLGGGNGAFIAASELSLKGFNVNLCEIPEFGRNIEIAKNNGGIDLEVKADTGFQGGFARLNKVGTDIKEAVTDRDIIFIIVPSFAQKSFIKWGAEYFSPEQILVLEPGNFGGAIEAAQILKTKGIKKFPILVEFAGMIYSGFKKDSGSVWVSGLKRELGMAAYPDRLTERALDKLQKIYPGLERMDTVLETGLSNGNTILHAPILALNAGWVEQKNVDFLFYWQGCTPSVGRIVEEVDDERMALGEKLGLKLITTKEKVLKYYREQGAKGNNLQEILSTNPVYEWDYAPKNFQHRFFLEDIPYGLVPMENLGNILGIKTPLITAIITIGSRLTDKNLRANARDLEKLGLKDFTKEELLEQVRIGGKDKDYFIKP